MRGKTCCRALEPDTLELALSTSSWSLISCTRSWMLLKADLGRELLLFFTAEGNLVAGASSTMLSEIAVSDRRTVSISLTV